MKKILAALAVVAIALSMVVGCSSNASIFPNEGTVATKAFIQPNEG